MKKFYLDLHPNDNRPPVAGDVLDGPRRSWRILESWETDSSIWPNRWTLILGPGMPHHSLEPLGDGRRLFSEPYARGEGPRDFFGVDP